MAEHHPVPDLDAPPIVVGRGESAAAASHPDQPLDDAYHVYEANPAPWWIALLWLCFFAFGAAYLILSLIP
jgi:hypothetical protein